MGQTRTNSKHACGGWRPESHCLTAAPSATLLHANLAAALPRLVFTQMAETEPTSGGLVSSVRRLVQIFGATLQNRAELFALELQEERYRLVEIMLLAGGAMVLALLCLMLFSAVIVFAFAAGRYRLPSLDVLVGFGLFRLFDITKPFPIRRLERLKGGVGVMADDVGAGIFALALLMILRKTLLG